MWGTYPCSLLLHSLEGTRNRHLMIAPQDNVVPVCSCPACRCLEPVQPPQAQTPSPAEGVTSALDPPFPGHPFSALTDWDPSDESSLKLESLWQIPPGMHNSKLTVDKTCQCHEQSTLNQLESCLSCATMLASALCRCSSCKGLRGARGGRGGGTRGVRY